MNTNKVNFTDSKTVGALNQGAIYKSDEERPDFFILARYGVRYACINLNNGNFWTDLQQTVEEAVEGLIFVASNVRMDIET